MKGKILITRRGMLELLGSIGLIAIPGYSLWRNESFGSGSPAPSLESVLRIFRNQTGAGRIGAEYLRLFPSEASTPALLRHLHPLNTNPRPASVAELKTTAERIFERHRDDFRNGRVVTIHGWFFSETELRLCAIAHLILYDVAENGAPSKGKMW